MTRKQRIRKIERRYERSLSKNCKKCGGTGWIRPGHRYGGCVCKALDGMLFLSKRDVSFLLKLSKISAQNGRSGG